MFPFLCQTNDNDLTNYEPNGTYEGSENFPENKSDLSVFDLSKKNICNSTKKKK